MKTVQKILLLAAILAIVQLAGCAQTPEVSQPTSEQEAASASSLLPESEPATAEDVVLDYDEIRTIAVYSASPAVPCEGYFTMSKDGLWGLMRADGTELLPCVSAAPVSGCGMEQHWICGSGGNPLSWEEIEALSEQLTASGDGSICPGHGGGGDMFFYNLDSEGRDPYALDASALRWYRMGTPGDVFPMEEELWDKYGLILPVFSAHEEGEEGDPAYPSEPVEDENGALYWYLCKDGSGLLIPGAKQALWFLDEELAPVQIEEKWAYVNRKGEIVAKAQYSPTWESDSFMEDTGPRYAACLQNGYAAVCRDGQWGLLNYSGKEVIPCEKQGVAWEGTNLWIKEQDGWHRSPLPA